MDSNTIPKAPSTKKLEDWKAHVKELHEHITKMLLNQPPTVELQDNVFLHLPATIVVTANSPADFKAEWGTPRIAELEITAHTEFGMLTFRDIEVLKLEKKPMLSVPSKNTAKEGDKPKYRDFLVGNKVKDAILLELGKAIGAGFKLTTRGRDPETQDAFDSLMGATDKKFVPKDKRTSDTASKDNKGEVETPDDAKKALGG